MADLLEELYSALYADLKKIIVPLVMQHPSHNLALSKGSATNAIAEAFVPLNKVLKALNMKAVSFMPWIGIIRMPSTTRSEIVNVMIESRNILEEKKGECMSAVIKSLEKLKGVENT